MLTVLVHRLLFCLSFKNQSASRLQIPRFTLSQMTMDLFLFTYFFFPLSPTKLLQDLTIRGAGWVSYLKRELLTLLKHLGWLPIFDGVHVAHIFSFLCCVLSVVVLWLVCPMLPVSLDCPFLIALSLFSNVYKHLPRSMQKCQIHIFLGLFFRFFFLIVTTVWIREAFDWSVFQLYLGRGQIQ